MDFWSFVIGFGCGTLYFIVMAWQPTPTEPEPQPQVKRPPTMIVNGRVWRVQVKKSILSITTRGATMNTNEILKRVESVEQGDYFGSLVEENWLAQQFNPAQLAKMLTVAYWKGRTDGCINLGNKVLAQQDKAEWMRNLQYEKEVQP